LTLSPSSLLPLPPLACIPLPAAAAFIPSLASSLSPLSPCFARLLQLLLASTYYYKPLNGRASVYPCSSSMD
jgi:hypothetical protein